VFLFRLPVFNTTAISLIIFFPSLIKRGKRNSKTGQENRKKGLFWEYYLKKYRMFAGKRRCFSTYLFIRDGKKDSLNGLVINPFLYSLSTCVQRRVKTPDNHAGAAKPRTIRDVLPIYQPFRLPGEKNIVVLLHCTNLIIQR
jgi:hypothetical protein